MYECNYYFDLPIITDSACHPKIQIFALGTVIAIQPIVTPSGSLLGQAHNASW
jgi:hypothetical protein